MLLHDNIMFNENGTLSTIPRHPLVWQQEMSGDRREDDVVVMPHIALLVCMMSQSIYIFQKNKKKK